MKNEPYPFDEDLTCSKTKVFRNDTKYEMTLEFKSVEIEFINTSVDSKDKFNFFLPLAILPIFYYLDLEQFKFVLTAIIKFKDNFTAIEIDYSILNKLLFKMTEFDVNLERLSTPKNINSYKFDWITQAFLFEVHIK